MSDFKRSLSDCFTGADLVSVQKRRCGGVGCLLEGSRLTDGMKMNFSFTLRSWQMRMKEEIYFFAIETRSKAYGEKANNE